uniref:Uncharacterized protein n=1 Tax=Vitrella brassicaformis TaxID=1169539 RepID=A0A7S1KBA2_9ALVE
MGSSLTSISDKQLADAMEKTPDVIRKLWPDEKEHRQMLEALETDRFTKVAAAVWLLDTEEEELKKQLPKLLLKNAAPESAVPPPSHDRDGPANDTVMTKKRKKGDQ